MAAVIAVAPAWGHAFPEHSEPGAGAEIPSGPRQVRIWFNVDLEPAFSSVVVKDQAGKEISTGSRVDQSHRRLEAKLPRLDPGEYHVFWRVVATDGHPTEGDYTFKVER